MVTRRSLTRRQRLQSGRRQLDVVPGAGRAFPDHGRFDRLLRARVRDVDGCVAGGLAGGDLVAAA